MQCILGKCGHTHLRTLSRVCVRPDGLGPPGSSGHGIFQARILEWVAISSSRGSSQPRGWTWVSCISCTVRWILYTVLPAKPRDFIILCTKSNQCSSWLRDTREWVNYSLLLLQRVAKCTVYFGRFSIRKIKMLQIFKSCVNHLEKIGSLGISCSLTSERNEHLTIYYYML